MYTNTATEQIGELVATAEKNTQDIICVQQHQFFLKTP